MNINLFILKLDISSVKKKKKKKKDQIPPENLKNDQNIPET